jgi:hypothetical protein
VYGGILYGNVSGRREGIITFFPPVHEVQAAMN